MDDIKQAQLTNLRVWCRRFNLEIDAGQAFSSIEAANMVAGGIDANLVKYEKDANGFGRSYASKLKIAERTFRDLFKKQEQYDKKRGELEIENEYLQMVSGAYI